MVYSNDVNITVNSLCLPSTMRYGYTIPLRRRADTGMVLSNPILSVVLLVRFRYRHVRSRIGVVSQDAVRRWAQGIEG